jgi:hypothetical protein
MLPITSLVTVVVTACVIAAKAMDCDKEDKF